MACLCQLSLIPLQQFLNSLAQHQCCPLLITYSVEYFYPPTAIINFLILFSRSSLSEWNSKNVPLIHYHILYDLLFILDFSYLQTTPWIKSASCIYIRPSPAVTISQHIFLPQTCLLLSLTTLNYFHSFNFFRPTSFAEPSHNLNSSSNSTCILGSHIMKGILREMLVKNLIWMDLNTSQLSWYFLGMHIYHTTKTSGVCTSLTGFMTNYNCEMSK